MCKYVWSVKNRRILSMKSTTNRSNVIDIRSIEIVIDVNDAFELTVVENVSVWVLEYDVGLANRVESRVLILIIIVVVLLNNLSAILHFPGRVQRLIATLLTTGQFALEPCVNHFLFWHIIGTIHPSVNLGGSASPIPGHGPLAPAETFAFSRAAHRSHSCTLAFATLFAPIFTFLLFLESFQALLKIAGDIDALRFSKLQLLHNRTLLQCTVLSAASHYDVDVETNDEEDKDQDCEQNKGPVWHSSPWVLHKPRWFFCLLLRQGCQQLLIVFKLSDEELSGFEWGELGKNILVNIFFEWDNIARL
jgi:hypothetical protein